MTLYCPITGLKVVQKPEWKNHRLSDACKGNFFTIGDMIVYNRPKGFANLAAIKEALVMGDQVSETVGQGRRPFIQIEDFSQLKGSSSEARRYYARVVNKNDRRSSVIFCNVPLPAKIAIKIGKRFVRWQKYVHVVKDYKAAVELAMSLNQIQPPVLKEMFRDILKGFAGSSNALCPVDLSDSEKWQIKTKDYANQAIVINHKILHSCSKGFIRSRDIAKIEQMRRQCQSDLPGDAVLKYIVVNAQDFKAGSRTARFEYMQSLRKWHAQFPFRMYIVYNANIFMKTALKIAAPLMPFRVESAKNLNHAIQLIQSEEQTSLPEVFIKSERITRIHQRDIEALLAAIGDLNWENDGNRNQISVASTHPFFYVYEALKLIKEELDELFEQRKNLESRLHQSQKMESVGRLAGGVAHDFNNILQMIMGNTDLAMADVSKGSDLHKNLTEIKEASLKGAGIIKQLLNFSRKAEPQIKPVDAFQVIMDAIEFLRAAIPANIQITKEISENFMIILADPVQINQVLMNICINASQEMERTGGTIHISTEEEMITPEQAKYVSDLKPGSYYKIMIKDTGPGISPDIIDKIFDPYFTTKEIGKGSGMGLSVVHGIIKKHKGQVLVESVLNEGTSFTILIPQAGDQLPRDFEMAEAPKFGNESILFVDDEKTINYLTKKGMEKLGYKVQTCLDPEVALDLFRSQPHAYDIVITDMAMPQMTGIAFFNQVRKIHPDIPVIICTGYSNLIDQEESDRIGFSAYVMKPFLMEDLSALIRQIVDENKS